MGRSDNVCGVSSVKEMKCTGRVMDRAECMCSAKPKAKKVTDRTKLHTLDWGKFKLEREKGSSLQREKIIENILTKTSLVLRIF